MMSKILTTYSDEYLEHWAKVYLANPILRRRGVLFAAFLVSPEEILVAVAMPQVADLEEYRPLLPAQRRVQHRQDWVALASAKKTAPAITSRLKTYWQPRPYKTEMEPS